ncbi:hypothetical protein H238_0525 [Klebsiella pneumoniae UHKPC179]|uniref:Uncharacterized protein n=2 Tax=Klebsiella pneumoniae complex TaxID=3390273 RepID=B5XNU4_KLEV3|nr:hypothetical protein KPK_1461 [Klebsiella variicola]AHM78404.1 hypothetical protein KPNJ2_01624 [Klebsiella pneumoniae 30684/NJST258_2]AHM84061.1 hypothetical protein KPNJ1_01655 [Klebsiella pneumoniae 30660/NJST258_1]AVJ85760.1 hypothetical protein CSC00_3805 [Klebsiella pneumoniae]EGF63227.1 hypothetical protein HMPREF9538_02338 [Klebsiella sp. MS 92-3]EJK89866.1 hypothetical protein UUU_29850 [Klebsiella pneumoniae subsp. pneumoniae DSM 30104 = JCM 1662 = NBRC 14940]EOR14343.1 hypotheti
MQNGIKSNVLLSSCPKTEQGMMLIINVEVILRYANDTLTFF